jgi:hypothetical protein
MMLDNPKGIMKRGKPDSEIVHLRVKQHYPGMKESNTGNDDYNTRVKCSNGSWHIYFTNDPSKVTCEKCNGKS